MKISNSMARPFLALALIAAAPLVALDFQPSVDVQVGGGYSEIQGGPGSTALAGQAMLLPIWKLGSRDFLIPALYATDGERTVSLNEVGTVPELFTQSLVLTGEPVWKHYFADSGWVSGVYGQAIHNYNQDNIGEILGDGIYDNEIYGGGLQLSKKDLASWLAYLSLDASYNHWHFPNYVTGDRPHYAGINYNYYGLDMNVQKLDLNMSFSDGLTLYGSVSDRNYTDSYVYGQFGSLTNDDLVPGELNPRRHDYYSVARLGWSHALTDTWSLSAQLEGDYQASNYDYFNWNTLYFNYDYFSNRVGVFAPSLSWAPTGDPKRDFLSLSWRAQYVAYLHRTVFNPDGTPTMGTEDDFENTLTLFARKMLWRQVGLYGRFSLDAAQSNQGLQASIAYNYSVFDSQIGLEYQY